jgi:hypothetical protein
MAEVAIVVEAADSGALAAAQVGAGAVRSTAPPQVIRAVRIQTEVSIKVNARAAK